MGWGDPNNCPGDRGVPESHPGPGATGTRSGLGSPRAIPAPGVPRERPRGPGARAQRVRGGAWGGRGCTGGVAKGRDVPEAGRGDPGGEAYLPEGVV